MRQNVQKCLNRNLIRGSFLENMLKATLTSKANVLSVWKGYFLFFYKFLSDEVETVFSEKEAKHLIIFKSKFGHRKLLRKWFWSYLDLKNECSEHLKWSFFSFLQIFEWWGQIIFQESKAKLSKLFKSKFGHSKVLRKCFWSYIELKNKCSQYLKRTFFSFFTNFWVTKLKLFFGKAFKTI